MGGGAFGYGQSSQNSQSNSGLYGAYKDKQNEDAYFRNQFYGQQAQNAFNAPFGSFMGQTGAQMLGLNPTTGLPTAFNNYMGNMANTFFSRASAGGSYRGQMSPENTQNIVGQAIRGMGATALPYVSDFAKQATMLPEQMMAQRLGYLQAAGANDAALLGSSSKYEGDSLNLSMSGYAGAGAP